MPWENTDTGEICKPTLDLLIQRAVVLFHSSDFWHGCAMDAHAALCDAFSEIMVHATLDEYIDMMVEYIRVHPDEFVRVEERESVPWKDFVRNIFNLNTLDEANDLQDRVKSQVSGYEEIVASREDLNDRRLTGI